MKKNFKMGFTLIELLAIIVILAVIAVITVPIILNIVENSKKGAVTSSAMGYKDAVNKAYVSELSRDNSFTMDNKTYTADELKESGVNVDGSEPEGNSWVAVVDNKVVDGCLQFDDYMVNVEYNYVSDAVKGQCASIDSWTQTIYPTILKSAGGTAYYASEWIKANPVFYNPVTNSTCTEGASGCMKWYAYSESNGKVNMLLDHNLDYGYWASIYDESTDSNYATNQVGPTDIFDKIDEGTSSWSSRLIRHDIYSVSWNYDNTNYSYTIDYNGKKARLISAEEVAELVGVSGWTNNGSMFYLGSGNSTEYYDQTAEEKLKQETYSWLFDNMYYCDYHGCDEGHGIIGLTDQAYWTSTPKTDTSDSLWCMCFKGCIDESLSYDQTVGIRPVVSVSKVVVY